MKKDKIINKIPKRECPRSIMGAVRLFILSFIILVSFSCQPLFAQNISIALKADSTHILIGNFMNVKLSVKYEGNVAVSLPHVLDTLGNMDVIKTSPVDTSTNGNFKTLTQTFTVSAYDSGTYHISPQKILYKNKSGGVDSILSDFVFVKVYTVAVDTSKPVKDIKNPIEVPYTLREFLPYIITGFVLLAIIVAAIFFIWRRRKNNKPLIIGRPKPKEPAHIWARKELKKLEEERLWQQDQVKLYYSRLTDILRLYLEYRYSWFALESTTEEIIDTIDKYGISIPAKESLLSILSNADLVKFARMLPLPDVHAKAMENAYQFISYTEQKEVKPEEKNNV